MVDGTIISQNYHSIISTRCYLNASFGHLSESFAKEANLWFSDHTARLMSATVLLGVLWPITDVQLYVLMWSIASREVRCFECLLHAVTSLPRNVHSETGWGWPSFTELNISCRATNRFYSTMRDICFCPLWVRILFSYRFDAILHGQKVYVIYYRHVGHSGLINEQIGQHRLMARPNIVALYYHSDILLSVLIVLNALFPYFKRLTLSKLLLWLRSSSPGSVISWRMCEDICINCTNKQSCSCSREMHFFVPCSYNSVTYT